MKNIQIFTPIDLSGHDHKVLSLLYRPLIGTVAFSLYQLIFAYGYQKNVTEIEDTMLLNLLVVTQQELEKATNILQAHALLDVFEKEDTQLYQLKKPMTAKQFLTDTIFGITLEHKVGKKTLSMIVEQFKVLQPSIGFSRKEVLFEDVFDINQVKRLSIHEPLFENGGVHHPFVKSSFPYEAWVDQLPSVYQKPTLLKQSMRQLIENLVYIYQFQVEDLNTIIASLHPSQITKKEAIQLAAKRYFEKHQVLTIDEKNDGSEDYYAMVSPLVIIQKYAKSETQASALDTVASLTQRHHIDMGVMNVLLMFVLKRKDGVLPHLHYLEKILNDWLSKGVLTSQDAIEMTTKLETTYQKKTYKKAVRVSVEPDWLDDYLDQLKKEEESL